MSIYDADQISGFVSMTHSTLGQAAHQFNLKIDTARLTCDDSGQTQVGVYVSSPTISEDLPITLKLHVVMSEDEPRYPNTGECEQIIFSNSSGELT